MFGNVFFRDFPYKLVTHARVFSLSFVDTNINPKAALFISVNMQFLNKIFSYSNMASWQKIKKLGLAVFVPFKNEKIDFEYMEKFINILEEERLQILETYLQVNSLDNCQLTDAEQLALDKITNKEIKFKEFYVTGEKGVFDVNNTHSILKEWITPNSGTIPYVTASESNNSIVTYISYNKDSIEQGNSIMIGGKTLVVTYQEQDYFSNDSHNLALYLKNKSRTVQNQLFLVSCLYKNLKHKYSWGDSISNKKIKDDTVWLPVTDDNEIDYDFMETYIKAIEKKVIQKVITWKDSEMKTLKIVS